MGELFFKARYKKWCMLIMCGVAVLLLDTIFQYNVVSSIFKDSRSSPYGEGKSQKTLGKQQDSIKIHARRLQEIEDIFFEKDLKNHIDMLHARMNLSIFYTPQPEFRSEFTLKELFPLDNEQGSHDRLTNEVHTGQKTIPILFNSYIRGGSAVLVDIITRQLDAFYFPEPLWTITPFAYFTADNFLCSSKTGHCRQLRKTSFDSSNYSPDEQIHTILKYKQSNEYPLDTALRILRNIFTCNFDKDFDTLPIENLPYSEIGHGLRRFAECRQRSSKAGCLKVLADVCNERKVRVAKVLRLTLAAVENLLRKNKDVKVVHLFRDPRAIMSSRLYNAEWYNLQKTSRDPSIAENARALCEKTILDYRSGTRLMQLFPDRFIFARYEDLTSSNKGNIQIGNLFKFLNIEPDVTKMVTYKNSLDWRHLMSFKDVGLVDRECHEVYDKLGYLTFKTEGAMKNWKLESFVSI